MRIELLFKFPNQSKRESDQTARFFLASSTSVGETSFRLRNTTIIAFCFYRKIGHSGACTYLIWEPADKRTIRGVQTLQIYP